MKKLVLMFSLAIVSLGCGQEKTIKFQADITNLKENEIEIWDQMGFTKKIKGDKNGHFETVLQAKDDLYSVLAEKKHLFKIYLKKGDDLNLKADANNFYKTFTFSGKGAEENNFMAERGRRYAFESIIRSEDKDFKVAISDLYAKDLAIIEKSNFDPHFVDLIKSNLKEDLEFLKESHASHLKKQKWNNTLCIPFEYENHDGGKTKLADFKGKYVYIDIWATWCGACIAELPDLKKIEEKYRNKNIAFVGISIDEAKAFEKWKTFVTNNQMPGNQLFVRNNDDKFTRSYIMGGIPRFILIDPTGKIIDADAYRPSSPQLVRELDNLLVTKA